MPSACVQVRHVATQVGVAACECAENNNRACEFDGGDCCKSTCRSKTFDCVMAGVCREQCHDPAAAAHDEHCSNVCQWGWVGDGRCDEANNKVGARRCALMQGCCGVLSTVAVVVASDRGAHQSTTSSALREPHGCRLPRQAECEFDGGDCCASTCTDAVFKCRESAVCHMQCLDPHGTNAGCDGRSPHSTASGRPSSPHGLADQIGAVLRYPMCEGEPRWTADGHCDPQNNNHRFVLPRAARTSSWQRTREVLAATQLHVTVSVGQVWFRRRRLLLVDMPGRGVRLRGFRSVPG